MRRTVIAFAVALLALSAIPQIAYARIQSAVIVLAPDTPGRIMPVGEASKYLRVGRIAANVTGRDLGAIRKSIFCANVLPFEVKGGPRTFSDEFQFSNVLRETLVGANYKVAGNPNALFEDAEDTKASLIVAGVITDIRANLCYPDANPNTDYASREDLVRSSGEVSMDIAWQVYNQLERKVVLEIQTHGTGKVNTKEHGADDAILAAFTQAARNLASQERFQALVGGNADNAAPVTASAAAINARIARQPLSSQRFQDQITDIRSKVVTVFSGAGMGTGFFVNDGFVLTNEHVVGGAKFVKVKLVTGREIVGEVLAANSARDVALIKTEDIGIKGLPLRSEESPVSAQVFVIGSPLDKNLQSSVSSGIVSAYRVMNGQRFIQSDVTIQPGNSGGPMMDEHGNVIGISDLARMLDSGVPAGINFFIPIDDALTTLGIAFAN
jgi:serine protease Do